MNFCCSCYLQVPLFQSIVHVKAAWGWECPADTASLLTIGAKDVVLWPATAAVVQSRVCKTHHCCCTEEEKLAESRAVTELRPSAETPLRHRRDDGGCWRSRWLCGTWHICVIVTARPNSGWQPDCSVLSLKHSSLSWRRLEVFQ